MPRSLFSRLIVLLLLPAACTVAAHARELSFEQRVRAQEALERVHHSHQIGTSKSFEQAWPRALLEDRVSRYLKQSLALERVWHTPITAEMLARELERMASETRMPDRLRELYAALDDDPFLLQECLVRAALADRLIRRFFAADPVIHQSARKRAEDVLAELRAGRLSPADAHPERTVVELVPDATVEREVAETGPDRSVRLRLDPQRLAAPRSLAPARVGEVGKLQDDLDAYVVTVVLDERPDLTRLAVYRFDKRAWEDWWGEVSRDLDPLAAPAVATSEALPGLPGSTGCVQEAWINHAPPINRSEHSAVWTGTVMLVWGGFGPVIPHMLDSGSRYDPATDTWTVLSTLGAPTRRRQHSAVWTGSRMIVWGGQIETPDYEPVGTGGSYDPASDTWIPLSEAGAPSPRTRHQAVWTGSEMLVWGGGGVGGHPIAGGRYNPSSDTWFPMSIAGSPQGRVDLAAAWTGNAMFVWGGYANGSLSTGGLYDPASDSWTLTSPIDAPGPRYLHTAVWTGLEVVVWGGLEGTASLGNGGRYNPLSNAWKKVETAGAPSARHGHSAVWTGSRMIVFGGGSQQGSSLGTGGSYDPAADSWTPTSTAGAPTERYQQTAVWTGDRMLVWGGFYDAMGSDYGGRYDPSSDTWAPMAFRGAPEGRWKHTAVWTGNQMIVWGGVQGTSFPVPYLASGGRYDPAIDHWTPTSTVNAPSARGSHIAVWTGDVMVVWGGVNGGYLNTGGRYDPSLDSWTPTSLVNAPSGRQAIPPVWTGNRMIVWGGSGLSTGGRYDPEADAWAPTTTLNAPAGRLMHSAVWSGSRMIVWGGQDPDPNPSEPPTYPRAGALYDPVGDAWSPTSEAPSGSEQHLAVWTGEEMLVWGGDPLFGQRYDPATDLWQAMSTVGVPESRVRFTALWTGSTLVVWGGHAPSGFGRLNTGGVYDPSTDVWQATSLASVPAKREYHSAVWTGSEMLVWGGGDTGLYYDNGARYLASSTDDDHDGFDECQGDCLDGESAVHPGAAELCDGLDNDCGGTIDEGFPTPGPTSNLSFSDRTDFAWTVEPLADRYDVVRGDLNQLAAGGGDFTASLTTCLVDDGPAAAALDAEDLEAGSAFYYLVRAQRSCKSGTYSSASPDEQPGRDAEIAASGVACP